MQGSEGRQPKHCVKAGEKFQALTHGLQGAGTPYLTLGFAMVGSL